MRNPTVTPTSFEQWLAERASGVIALPMQSSSDALRRPLSAAPVDQQRLANLAGEILAAATKLAAIVEIAQRTARVQYRRKARVRTGGPGDV